MKTKKDFSLSVSIKIICNISLFEPTSERSRREWPRRINQQPISYDNEFYIIYITESKNIYTNTYIHIYIHIYILLYTKIQYIYILVYSHICLRVDKVYVSEHL
ncbi:hypothetical protein V1477_021143 [Vespula maculifrons]|uniref:Uncharacterized protein n=1 Tax=Vespula maculifrons TaxID=7453 RepID=A0ABD2AH93_VESMC